jgi:hypothetical protein
VVLVIVIVIPIPIPIAVPIVAGDASMPARAAIEVATSRHVAHMAAAVEISTGAACKGTTHMAAAAHVAAAAAAHPAGHAHSAAAHVAAAHSAHMATATATAAAAPHELDHAGRGLQVKGGACLCRQLCRRQ